MKRPLSERRSRRRFLGVAGAVVVALLAALWWTLAARVPVEEYASFTRPDGHYRVIVLRIPPRTALMPGQAGDAPGVVRLYDRQGRLLHETRVDMVQRVQKVEWTEKAVGIKLVADWSLPD